MKKPTVDYDLIRKLHEKYGVPLTSLARLAGVTRQAVFDYFKKRGWEYTAFPARSRLERHADLIRKLLVVHDVTKKDMAELLECNPATLDAVTGVFFGKGPRGVPEPQQQAIVRALESGMTQNEVALLTGFTQATISRVKSRVDAAHQDREGE